MISQDFHAYDDGMRHPAPPSAEELEQLAKLWFCQAPALSAQQMSEIDAWTREHPAQVSGRGDGIPRATRSG